MSKGDEIWGQKNFDNYFTFYLMNKGYDSVNFGKLSDPIIPDSFVDELKKRKT